MSTILIVEDVQTDREVYARYLNSSDWQLVFVGSGEEALERLEVDNPQAIVLDIVLPGLSGFEFCRKVKFDDNTRHIPVILCSSKKTDMDRFWGLKQGADFYLNKPIDRQELLSTLKKCLINNESGTINGYR
jgi:two-component system, chemotaxis family, response regulator PixH